MTFSQLIVSVSPLNLSTITLDSTFILSVLLTKAQRNRNREYGAHLTPTVDESYKGGYLITA
jgi:hypothetical protein